jgi:NDP-sugar pyrophosphorylase family protein
MIEHVVMMAAHLTGPMEKLTRTRPKAMFPILGKPMIAHAMEPYYQAGVRRFTVVIGEREGSVPGWLSEHWHPDSEVQFAAQGHRRGSAATLFASQGAVDEPFLIAPCDRLLPVEQAQALLGYFDTYPNDAAMVSMRHAPDREEAIAGVLLDPRGQVVYVAEWPTDAHQDHLTTLPIYGLTPKVFEYLEHVPVIGERGQRALASAIQVMIDDRLPVGAVKVVGCVELDGPDDLLAANMRALAALDKPVLRSDLPPSTKVVPPVQVDAGVIVGEHVQLGPNVYLESGSRIGSGVTLRDSLVLGVRVGGGQQIEGQIVSRDTPK